MAEIVHNVKWSTFLLILFRPTPRLAIGLKDQARTKNFKILGPIRIGRHRIYHRSFSTTSKSNQVSPFSVFSVVLYRLLLINLLKENEYDSDVYSPLPKHRNASLRERVSSVNSEVTIHDVRRCTITGT